MTNHIPVSARPKTQERSAQSGLLLRRCQCGQHTIGSGECTECQKKRLQRKARDNSAPGGVPSIVNRVLDSAGKPLDPTVRADMESRFGQDLSRVRIHTGNRAAESARAVNALAYTVGRDIVFGAGQYAPVGPDGRRLLAHELVHTLQQGSSSYATRRNQGSMQVSKPGDRDEREADTLAARLVAGQALASTVTPVQPGIARLQRQADISQAPPGLPCILVTGAGHLPGTDVLFGLSSSDVSASRADITAFVQAWVASGSRDDVIVDGWASVDGPQELNWRLSCERAEAVKAELVAQGIPSDKVTTLAHGESTEFSSTDLTQNRRAIITRQAPVTPPPTPPTPTPPTPTPPTPTPPTPAATITSETVETTPAPRTRTTIGVGEEVNLTNSAGSVAWSTTAGTLSAARGATVKLTAPDTAQTVTVTGGGTTIAFTVIAPDDVHMDRFGTTGVKHTKDRPDSGIETQPFLLPDTVNFHNVQYHEVDVSAVCSGVYTPFNGVGHDPHPATISLSSSVVSGKGTQANGRDCVYSGDPGTAAPFAAGSITFDIPYEYKVGAGSFHRFATVTQQSSMDADGSTLNSSKAGANGGTTVASPTIAIADCP